MRKMDINTKWICILGSLILACVIGLPVLSRVLPASPVESEEPNFVSIPWPAQLIYFSEQKHSGVPWVLLASIDIAEERTADASHTRLVAQTLIDAGAEQRGLFVFPVTTAADAIGLYNADRTFLKHAATQALSLSELDGVIRGASFPSRSGTPQNDWMVSGTDGCSVHGTDVITPVWEGTVLSVQGDTVQIESPQGLVVAYQGLSDVHVQVGQTVASSTALGRTQTLTVRTWQNGQAFNPYPLLYLLMPTDATAG